MQSLVCAEVLQCLMVSVADSRQSLKGTRAAVRSSRIWIHCVFDFELILLIGHSETCYHCQTFSDPSVVAPRGVTAHGLRRVLTEEVTSVSGNFMDALELEGGCAHGAGSAVCPSVGASPLSPRLVCLHAVIHKPEQAIRRGRVKTGIVAQVRPKTERTLACWALF